MITTLGEGRLAGRMVLTQSWSMSRCGFWIIPGLRKVCSTFTRPSVARLRPKRVVYSGSIAWVRTLRWIQKEALLGTIESVRIEMVACGIGGLCASLETELHRAAMNLVENFIRPLARMRKSATALRYL